MFVCRENQYRSNSNMVRMTRVKIRGMGADLLICRLWLGVQSCSITVVTVPFFFFFLKPISATHSYYSIADSERQ